METITIIQIVGIIIWVIYFLMVFIRWWNKRKSKKNKEAVLDQKIIFIKKSDINFLKTRIDNGEIADFALKENTKGYKITVKLKK